MFLRGCLQVSLVAMNTRQLAKGHIGPAMVVGFLISALWWANSSKDRPAGAGVGCAYALGAACGTGLGYLIAEWLS
jgi:hypothetical protein